MQKKKTQQFNPKKSNKTTTKSKKTISSMHPILKSSLPGLLHKDCT